MPAYRNVMEILLEELFDKMKDQLDCCTCEECRSDIIALALNQLPPHYVRTPKGELLSKLDQLSSQNSTDALAALTQAVEKVKASPRH